MARVSIIQTNFTAGEISPRLSGRVDIDRYNNAARRLVNAYPVIHGGAKRRPGTRYVAATKISAKRSRLIPFVYSRDAAYMLEVGDNYLRVYAAGGTYTGQELATSYSEAVLPDIDYTQGADTMFLAHPTVPMQRLRRLGSASFHLSDVPFVVTPFEEQGHALAADLTLSAATIGAGRTVTASAGVFLPSDNGRLLISSQGVAKITAYTSPTSLTATIQAGFSGTALASGTWYLDASPQAAVKPSGKDPIGSSIDLFGALTRVSDITLSAKTGAIVVTATSGVFAPADVGKKIYADSGVAEITAFTNTTHVNATTSSDFASTSYVQGGYGITNDVWRTEDVGKFVILNGGLCKIDGFVDASRLRATIVKDLTSDITCPPLAWSLESGVWNATNGYPRTVTLHEQRMVAAGSTRYPQTIWGSRTGEYLDFTKGTDDTDSYSFTIAADEVNPISFLAALRNLVVHTYGGEFSMQGGVEKPITPTNVRVRPETNHGSTGVRPVTVGKESVFVQRAGRKLRAMGYSAGNEEYSCPDLTVLAEHITERGSATELAFQQEPDLLLWAVRADGAMMSCTLDREQSVVGWGPGHYTEGFFESVATIPNGDRDETWVIVRRWVNGAWVRYLEIFDDTFAPLLPGAPSTEPPKANDEAPVIYGYTVDSGVAFDNPAGQTTFSVPHLIGCTVDILADGAVQLQQEVPASGNITLGRASYRTLIGLHFRSEIGLLTPEVGTGSGTAQGNSMRTSELTMRFLNTIGARVYDGENNEQKVPFRNFGTDVLDRPPPSFTGNVRIETLGWERGKSEFTIVQDQPLPMHLLSVVRKFQAND